MGRIHFPYFQLIIVALLVSAQPFCLGNDARPVKKLVPHCGWVQFDVMDGRITAHKPRYSQRKTTSVEHAQSGLRQSLSVAAEGGDPAVSYQSINAERRVSVEVIDGDQVEIRVEPRGTATTPSIRLLQPKQGPLSLTVQTEQARHTIRADSLWHLLLADPQRCTKHLIPVLEWLRPNWQLTETASQIEQALFGLSEDGPKLSQATVKRLVQQLGSERFRERQAAERELGNLGQVVVSHLKRLPQETLSSEQNARIRGLLTKLSVRDADRAERIAIRLLSDPAIWFILLSHADATKRKQAHAQLERICQQQLVFQPEGSATTRQRQIKQIQRRLGLKN